MGIAIKSNSEKQKRKYAQTEDAMSNPIIIIKY